ncbi:MAG: 2-amino-4-hydroxy-6-hydroxymethyldihydropteridine diphosphokinase [Bordetella sp.]|uniref:2-amino-4-hydroxy-6- hydroxymethyldihydropteridine diphosphokinase n=1 Tax=Bordetella sp. TaxID=28081 RepID=UPI003F7C2C63
MHPARCSAPIQAYIGLGSNLGDSGATLRTALREIAALSGVQACTVSPFYRSAPVDASGPDFINAAALLATTLEPLSLLDALQAIELRHGRQRPYRNAPRTLDLDLLLHGDAVLDTPRLILPHPRMHERAFVLRPLQDLAPTIVLPQGPIGDLIAGVAGQAIERLPAENR